MQISMNQLRELFQELKIILENENGNEQLHIIHQLDLGIHLIDKYLKSSDGNNDLKQLFNNLEEIYQKINRPRVGLTDFFIWRDSYEDRLIANDRLDTIKENLSLIFKEYNLNDQKNI